MTLMVSPIAESAATDARIASGIEIVMMSVERQLPRKMRIIRPVRAAATTPSKMTELTAELTKDDWSLIVSSFRLRRQGLAAVWASSALTPLMTSSVEADPDFRIVIRTAFAPSTRTMLICGGAPKCDIGDVANEHGRPVDDADRHVVDLVERVGERVERDDIFEVADLLGSDGRDDILLANRIDDVLRRQSVGLQLILIDVDLHLEDFAAVGRGNCRARDLRELGPDEILSGVLKSSACESDLLDSASWMTGRSRR